MKIKKIKDKELLENQFEIELQSCWDDCTEYMAKTEGDYNLLTDAGYNANSGPDGLDLDSLHDAVKNDLTFCFKSKTPKISIYF